MAMNAMDHDYGESSCAQASDECLICQEKYKRSAEKTFLPCVTAQDNGEFSCAEASDECLICQEKYKKSAVKTFLPCTHYFHKKCIDKWLAARNSCPVCRTVSTKDTLPTDATLLTDDSSLENDVDAFNIHMRSVRFVGMPDAQQMQQVHQAEKRMRQVGKEMEQNAHKWLHGRNDTKHFTHEMNRLARKMTDNAKLLKENIHGNAQR